MKSKSGRLATLLLSTAVSGLLSAGCGSSDSSSASAAATTASCASVAASFSSAKTCAAAGNCPANGVAWSPAITGAGSGNHDGTVTETRTTTTQNGLPLVGLSQAAPASAEVTFTIDMTDDLGEYGSLGLEATVSGFPSAITGTAYPLLVYLSDGVNDYINLPRAGVSGDCANAGYYTCTGSSCVPNPGCAPSWPSAYMSRAQWEQHQVTNQNASFSACGAYPSFNVFPSCNWTQGVTPATVSAPGCAFNETFFPGTYATPRLRYGGTYTAKYVLITSDYASLQGYSANLSLTVVKKHDVNAGGAVDLNVYLVGDQNVSDSHTAKGQQNLNLLFDAVYNYYNQASTGIKLGAINAVEWPSAQGGGPFTNVDVSEIGFMFQNALPIQPSATPGQAINVFLVTTLPEQSGTLGGLTVLGISGAVGGPTTLGTSNSGVVVSTFGSLGSFNSGCTVGGACPQTSQDAGFVSLGETIAHEIGHYLGLNHPSEASGAMHDQVYDTPICTSVSPTLGYTTIASCMLTDSNVFPVSSQTCNAACGSPNSSSSTYCPAAEECQFNHIMWWTSKRYNPSSNTGDGNLFSSDSGLIMNYNPYVQ